ncbi:MAG TPA: hypothetical protein DET40_15420 [Lentisphaeria bacterium]|nr:MAG: hypothetical protein A2X45_05390 [Lentisphaerae bacterium GWF2_50_93]HCE44928.1 hypothetical protein [Lentisphaeria bacterium]
MNSRNHTWIRSGVELVDEQHKEYFRRLDILLGMMEKSELNDYELRRSFDFFRSYAVVHFDTEELLMKISSYPETEGHMRTHEFFSETIERMAEELSVSRDISLVAEELKVFLTGWLEDHIETFDLKLTKFLKERVLANELKDS